MPRRAKILVYRKKSAPPPEQKEADGKIGQAMMEGLEQAHHSHISAMERLEQILASVAATVRYVFLTDRAKPENYDLVIALGGDGTVLHASHHIGRTPVLGINSSPRHSVGFLTATNIDEAERQIERALDGALPVTRLSRMAVDVDGVRVYSRVLNDVLFSHGCPASTTRYVIGLGDVEEKQTSSGIWIGPAAGSTAAQRSAGGRVLPVRSKKLQFVVREPYQQGNQSPYRLAKGLVSPGEHLEVRSMMDSARMYVDGPHVAIPVHLGQVTRFQLSEEPLNLLGFEREKPG